MSDVAQLDIEFIPQLDRAEKELKSFSNRPASKAGKKAGVNFGRGMSTAIGAVVSKISFDALFTQANKAISEYDKLVKSNISLESAIKGTNRELAKTGESIELQEVQNQVDNLFNRFEGVISRGTIQQGLTNLFNAGITSTEEATDVLLGFVDVASTSNLPLEQAVGNLTQAYKTESSELGDLSGLTDNFASQIIPRGLKALQKEGKLRDKKINDLTKEERNLAKIAGLQKNFNLTQGNFNDQLESGALKSDKASSKIKIMRQEFGEAIKPIQILVLEALIPLIENITTFIDKNPKLVAGLTIGAGLFTVLATSVLAVVSALSFLAPGISLVTTALSGAGLAGSLASLFNPITLIIGSIAAITAGLIALYNRSEIFRNRVNSAFEFVKNSFTSLKDNFALNVGKIIGFFVTLPIKLPFYIAEALIKMSSEIKGFDWSNAWNGIVEYAKKAGQRIIDYFASGEFLNSIKNAINGVVQGALQGTPLEGKIQGFQKGGYTGKGPANEIAGFVHKNEFVINSQIVDKIGLSNLQSLIAGISGGGGVTDNRDMSNNTTINNYGLQTANSFF